jgi:hypothetical protein
MKVRGIGASNAERIGRLVGISDQLLRNGAMAQQQLASLRAIQPIEPMDAREIDRESRAAWEAIAEECGERRGLAGIIARTYLVCRDLQKYAATGRVRRWMLLRVPALIAAAVDRSYGMAVMGWELPPLLLAYVVIDH